MNTVKKGDKLEAQIFKLFKEQISNDEFLFFKRDTCKIFLKKGYYSINRKKNIIFDVSVEIYLPGEDDYSILVLIECKNYGHKVPVDDAEEFYSKTEQIEASVKPIIVSSNSFQQGTLDYSDSKGIALIRYYDPSSLKWELTRSPSSLISRNQSIIEHKFAKKGILKQDFESKYFDFYCYFNRNFTISINALVQELLISNSNKNQLYKLPHICKASLNRASQVAFISKDEIENNTCEILKKIDYESGEVSTKDITKYLCEKHGLEIIHEAFENETLGKISFKPLKITINTEDSDQVKRIRFTLCHEIGHFILGHDRYMSGEKYLKSDLEIENKPELNIKDVMNMEFQANYFASCLLLPKENLISDFLSIISKMDLIDRGQGTLYLDEQKCNLESFYHITSKLMKIYNVSRTVLKIRLKALELLIEKESSIKEVLPVSKNQIQKVAANALLEKRL